MPQVPAGWEETTLGEVSDITSSKRIFANEYKTSWIPFFRGKEITEKFYGNSISTELFISEERYKELEKTVWVPQEGDILLTSVWTLGNPYLVEKGMKFYFKDWNITRFHNFKDVSPKWLFYRIISPIGKEILSHAKIGSTQQAYTIISLKQLPIHLPPLPEQQAIAAVLSAFDDKIELLRAENQTLEQMGQELFKERFGKWKVGDELPAGWRVGKLGEIISLQWWFVHNINLAGWEKTKIAKMWVVDGKVFFNRNSVIWYPDIIPEKYKLEEWDLIICTRDVTQDRLVIWNVALVPDDLAKFWLYAWSNTWIVKTSFHKLFLFLLFRSRNFRNHIIQSAKGSTIVMITQDAFLYTNIIIPDQETLNQFDLVIKPLFNKIKQNSEQIQTLSATRDQLLPKLMSGEVRVEF